MELASDGRTEVVVDNSVIPYGVPLEGTGPNTQFEMYKWGGSREAIIAVDAGSYFIGDRLSLHSGGKFTKTGNTHSYYLAVATENKQATGPSATIRAALIWGDNRTVRRFQLDTGTDFRIGQAARVDGDGNMLHPSNAGTFVSHIAATDTLRGEYGLFYTRTSSPVVPVRTDAATYAAGDLLEVHGSSGEFRKTTNSNARYWAVAAEAKTTTSSDPLLLAEFLGGKV